MKAIFMPHTEWQTGKSLEFMRQSDCIAQELPLFANYSANTLSRALSACGIRARVVVDVFSKLPATPLALISTLCERGNE